MKKVIFFILLFFKQLLLFSENEIFNFDGNNNIFVTNDDILLIVNTNKKVEYKIKKIDTKNKENINNIESWGLSVGIINGVGITYRYLPGVWGFQVTFLPINNFYNFQAYLVGTSLIRELFYRDFVRFYLFGSSLFSYLLIDNIFFQLTYFALCSGAGFEIFLTKSISLNILSGISIGFPLFITEQVILSYIMSQTSRLFYPSFEVNILFNF